MIKYKIRINPQSFEFENLQEAQQKVNDLFGVGLWFFELSGVEVTPEDPEEEKEFIIENEEEAPEPPKTNLKAKKRDAEKDLYRPKRKRRTKAEMDVVRKPEHIKEQGGLDKRTKGNRGRRFPKELVAFVKKRVDELNNSDLCDEINEEFDLNIVSQNLSKWMYSKGIKRTKRVRTPKAKKEEIEGVKKKMGAPKKWTDEVSQYLKDNINNFSNKELCEELESQFNLKTNPDSLQSTLSQKGIKRDSKVETGVDQEIVLFISKSKTKEVYALRDKIIEKFEVDIPIAKLRTLMNQRKDNLPGETVEDEVLRIKKKRVEIFGEDNDIDDIL